jgi:hypothetical protein
MLDKITKYIFQSRRSQVWNEKRNYKKHDSKFLNAGERLLRTILIYLGSILPLPPLVRMFSLRLLNLERYCSIVAKCIIMRLERFESILLI